MAHSQDEKSTDAPTADVPLISKGRNASSSRLAVVALTICIVVVSGLLFFLGSPFGLSTPRPALFSGGIDWPDEPEEPEEPFNPLKRYSLNYDKVACWQNEGVWIKKLTPLELASIGLDRFHDTERSLDQAEEDAFCACLRTYGASFWMLPPLWPCDDTYCITWCESTDCIEPDIDNRNLTLGFPKSGGVWVLDGSQGWDKFYPGLSGLSNVLTIEERCKVIKDVSGKFCESMQACPETAALVGDVEVLRKDLYKD